MNVIPEEDEVGAEALNESTSEGEGEGETAFDTVNPDTLEDFHFDQDGDDHWLSEDHLFELQQARDSEIKAPPPLKTWSVSEPTSTVYVTCGKARRLAWDQGKHEIALHQKNVEALAIPRATTPVEKVYQFMFGSESKPFKLFHEKIGLNQEECLTFILTHFKSCRYKMSVKSLHQTDDVIKHLMPNKQCNEIWRKMANLTRHAHGESFWQEVESSLNGLYKTLFMESDSVDAATDGMVGELQSTFDYVIGLDDDKLHCNCDKGTDSDGLKKDHHAKDNRRGCTAHTACHSATASPLNVSFQRGNETVQLTLQRMINSMFGLHIGRTGRMDNVTLGMDRGCWIASSLFWSLDNGANVHGTIKRMPWVPFTFGDRKRMPKKTFPQASHFIPMDGHKDNHHAETKWVGGKKTAHRKLSIDGYRSGAGTAVSLAISSSFRKIHWDMVPATNQALKWHHDKDLTPLERQKKAFHLLEGEDQDDECIEVMLDRMEPRACEQGTADWFLDRQFAGTSSTVASLAVAVAPLIDETNPIYDSFKVVLEFTGFADLHGSAVEDTSVESQHNASDGDDDDGDDDDDDAKKEAQGWHTTLLDEACSDDQFRAQAKDINEEVLSWLVAIFKKKDYKLMQASEAIQLLDEEVLSHPKDRRPCEPLTIKQLKAMADDRNVKIQSSVKKPDIINALLSSKHQASSSTSDAQEGDNRGNYRDPDLEPLAALFRQSHVRPQIKPIRAAAAIGHRNEAPFLSAFYNECKKDELDDFSFGRLNPIAIYRLGLMKKKGSKFAKASLDGATFVYDLDGEIELIPTEVKSRVSEATMTEAIDRIEEVVGAEIFQKRAKHLIEATSNDGLLRLLIHDDAYKRREKQEAFQLLHGVYVSGAGRGLLLVGSKTALMYGVLVSFDEDLLEAHEKVMDYIYDDHIKPFYEDSVDALQNNDDVDKAIESINYLDRHSFFTSLVLWRALNVDVNNRNIWFPLCPCARTLPFQNAHWNVLKGPSDTTTKLLDNCEEHLGVRTTRTIATARLIGVAAVAFHRSQQMLTARSIDKHATLFDYRDAANHRFSMAGSLASLIGFISNEINQMKSTVAAAATTPPRALALGARYVVPPNSAPRRTTRAQEEAPERVQWSHPVKLGFTPMRGRPANQDHKVREQNCDGRVLVGLVSPPDNSKLDVRGKCRLCSTKTAFYCTGCKNYLCFGVSQALDEKRIKAIKTKDDKFADDPPKRMLKMMVHDPSKEEFVSAFAGNCCYCVQHKESLNECWQQKMSTHYDAPSEERSGDAES